MSVELSGYRLEVERSPSDGPVVAVHARCVNNPKFDAVWVEDAMERLLQSGREIDGERDPRSVVMPSEDSLLRACLADLCIEVDGEPADVAALPEAPTGWREVEAGLEVPQVVQPPAAEPDWRALCEALLPYAESRAEDMECSQQELERDPDGLTPAEVAESATFRDAAWAAVEAATAALAQTRR